MDALLKNFIRRKTLSASDGVGGSIGYMSPEMILSGHRSAAADVFAAGAVFYTMLCGSPPFEGPTIQIAITKTVCGNFHSRQ
jgi:serine/threonine protein kinase